MSSMKDSYLKSFNPLIAVKIIQLDDTEILNGIIKSVFNILSIQYKTFYDEEETTIYVAKV
jgi:hypothetical protein